MVIITHITSSQRTAHDMRSANSGTQSRDGVEFDAEEPRVRSDAHSLVFCIVLSGSLIGVGPNMNERKELTRILWCLETRRIYRHAVLISN